MTRTARAAARCIAAWRANCSDSRLLPIAGRAATTYSRPSCSPPSSRSSSRIPVASPGISRSSLLACSSRSSSSVTACSSSRWPGEHVVAAQREDQPLGVFDQVLSPAPALADLRLDLIGGAQQRSHERVVADDPAVFAGVPGGGHPAGELVDRAFPADLVELAVLAQGFGDGELVDPAAALVELEHRGEHQPVLFAVEVLGAQLLVGDERVAGGVRRAARRRAPTSRPRGCAGARWPPAGGRWWSWSCGVLLSCLVARLAEFGPQLGVAAL